MVDRFALLASASSGVQGEWPKILLTIWSLRGTSACELVLR